MNLVKQGGVHRLAKQGAPYLRTVHAWRCANGHETSVDDGGWPQQGGIKQAVLKAWAAYGGSPDELRCSTCHAKAYYTHAESEAPAPIEAKPEHKCPEPPDFKNIGRAFYAQPKSSGGSVEARANAGKKNRS